MTKVLLFAALVACIAVPFRVFVKGEQTKHRYKTTLALNGVMFFGLMLFTGVMMFSGNAFAAETAETAAVAASSTATGLGYIAAALSIGMSCIGGGIAVASAASAALGAISEDSSILGKSLIFVGLAEGVYGQITGSETGRYLFSILQACANEPIQIHKACAHGISAIKSFSQGL